MRSGNLIKRIKLIAMVISFVSMASFGTATAVKVYKNNAPDKPSEDIPSEMLPEGTPEESKAYKIELHESKQGDNTRFNVKDMMPGDTQTGYFCVKVTHSEDISVLHKVTVEKEEKALSSALNFKLTRLGEEAAVLYDGKLSGIVGKEFPETLKTDSESESLLYYKVDISLPSATGNEYQGGSLSASFNWYPAGEHPAPENVWLDPTVIPLLAGAAGSSLLFALFLTLVIREKEMEI